MVFLLTVTNLLNLFYCAVWWLTHQTVVEVLPVGLVLLKQISHLQAVEVPLLQVEALVHRMFQPRLPH